MRLLSLIMHLLIFLMIIPFFANAQTSFPDNQNALSRLSNTVKDNYKLEIRCLALLDTIQNQLTRENKTYFYDSLFVQCNELSQTINKWHIGAKYYGLKARYFSKIKKDRDSSFYYCDLSEQFAFKSDPAYINRALKESAWSRALIYDAFSKRDSALAVLLEAVNISNDSLTTNIDFRIVQKISTLYWLFQSYEYAMLFANRGLNLAKTKEEVLSALSNKARIYRLAQEYDSSLKLIDSCEHLAEQNGTLRNAYLSNILNDKFACLYHLKKYRAMSSVSLKQYAMAKETRDSNMILAALITTSRSYSEMGNKDSAELFLQKISDMRSAINNAEYLSKTFLNESLVYEKFKQFDLALPAYKRYSKMHDSLRDAMLEGRYVELTAKFESAEKDKQIAEQTLAINSKKLENLELEKNLKLNALRYEYEKKQRAAQTEEERKKLIYEADLRQQQIEHEAALKRQQIENENALAQAKLQEIALEKDKQIAQQQADLNQRRLLNVSFASLAGLLLLAGGFGYTRYRTRRRNERLLADKNERIETLMQELQHRVKNNMQMISSLLSLQSRTLTDTEARDAIQEGQHRIEAMSLIHQKLYMEDNVTSISAQEYLEELVQGLMKSFADYTANVELKMKIDAVTLPVDTAIPLGLITNELVTNALKYGLTALQPLLQITLNNNSGKLRLVVQDNGAGMQLDTKRNDSLGMKLVAALAKQINSTITIVSKEGTTVTIQQ